MLIDKGEYQMKRQIESIAGVWPGIANMFAVPNTKADYDGLIETISNLLDEINGNDNHPLNGLLDILFLLAKEYEDEHIVINNASPVDVLKYLMEDRGLSQSDLPEIGSQGVVSEVLNNKRKLNSRQIEKLSNRFNVSPAVFF